MKKEKIFLGFIISIHSYKETRLFVSYLDDTVKNQGGGVLVNIEVQITLVPKVL